MALTGPRWERQDTFSLLWVGYPMVSNQKQYPLWGKATCEMSAESTAEGQQQEKERKRGRAVREDI